MAAELEAKEITWEEEQRTLTLTGEPVLELSLSWPKVDWKPMRGVGRYYGRLCDAWKKHWEREGYWQACADLAQQRERSRPFRVWRGELSGQVTRNQNGMLSISMLAREVQGDGRVLEYRWGDTWRWEDGSVVTLKELFPKKKGWKKWLEQELLQAAQSCRQRGIYLDEDLERPLRRWWSGQRFALSEEGLIFYYPQCTIAPAVEGVVALCVPMPEEGQITTEEKHA